MPESIKAKIASLLNVTADNGATEAEAVSAMAIAAKLMEKYGVTLEDIANKTEAASDFIRKSAQGDRSYLHPVDQYVTNSIAAYTDTKAWNSKSYRRSDVNFFGYSVDVELALYIREVCKRAMDTEWNLYKNTIPKGVHSAKYRKSFLMGMGRRLAERLREMKKEQRADDANSNALVLAKNNIVNAEFINNIGHMNKAKIRTEKVSRAVYEEGKNAANNVKFHRNVNTPTTSMIKLLS